MAKTSAFDDLGVFGGGWFSKGRDHEHPVRWRSLARFDHDRAAKLGVATAPCLQRSGSGGGPIEIGSRCGQIEPDLLRCTGSDRHWLAGTGPRTEALDPQSGPQRIAQHEHDSRSFAHANDWSGCGEVGAFLAERGDVDGCAFRPCGSCAADIGVEPCRQHVSLKPAGRTCVVIGRDNARGRRCVARLRHAFLRRCDEADADKNRK